MAKKRGKAKQRTSKRRTSSKHKRHKKKSAGSKGRDAKKKKAARKKEKSRKNAPKKKRIEVVKPGKVEETIKKAPHELEEEFFVPSPVHKGKYRIPIGIKFLIGYLTFLAVLYLISFVYGITFPTTILFGKLITGTRALIINSVLLALILLMLYGFWKRKAYTFDLSIGFFSFAALNAVISLLLFESAEHPVFRKLLLLSFISLVIMNVVIVWYILHERKYFYAERFRDRPFHHRDKVFLYMIITFWVVALLIGITLGAQFYKDTTRLIDKNIVEMKGDYYRGQLVCESKDAGPEKDVCNLVLATAMTQYERPPVEVHSLCDNIRSDFYRFTCMRSIST